MENRADIYQPIYGSQSGNPPLVIRTVTTPLSVMTVGGVMSDPRRVEDYVLLSALPHELQERVRISIRAIIDGM